MRECSSVPFARDRSGWTLVILNLLMAANSTYFFIGMLRAGADGWLAMNSCAPSIFLFSIGYILASRPLMAIGAGCLFRFGTLGLFVFGWKGMNLIPQVGHILMTAAVIYFIVRMLRERDAGSLIAAGSAAVLLLYSEWQWTWFREHPEALDRLMSGTLDPASFNR